MTLARRRGLVAALLLVMFLAAMDSSVTVSAAPHIVAELGDGAAFSWLLAAYVLAVTASVPVYGKLADTHGRRPVIVGGTLLFLAGSALCAAGWSLPSLIAFRFVQGLGAGAIQGTVQTVAGDLYEPHERGRIQGALASVWSIAALVGPVVGGALAQYGHWRVIFLLNLPLGLSAVWLLARSFPKERLRNDAVGAVDWRGAVGLLLTYASLMALLTLGGITWPWLSVQNGALLTVFLVLVLVTTRIERRAAHPFIPGWVWQRRELAVASLTLGLMGVVMTGPLLLLPVYAQAVLGLGPAASAAVLAGMTFSWPTAALLSNRLYMRVGFRDAALIGAATVSVALVITVSLTHLGAHAAPFVAVSALLGIGFGMLQPALLVGVQAVVPWNGRGAATANLMFCRETGQSLGAALFGALFNAAANQKFVVSADCAAVCQEHVTTGFRYVYLTGTAVAVAMLFLLLTMPPLPSNSSRDQRDRELNAMHEG
ncbi:MFS transporter [Streptomyces parvulus]|uniref:MFS transporter n=1 Tax=Streptomyces parvulus TaxID=146923 RepID=UPI003821BABE